MNTYFIDGLSRREFISKTVTAGTAMYLGLGNDLGLAAVEPPPETTTVRFQQLKSPCWVPQLVAEPLLREEGFKDIQYIKADKEVGRGEEDIMAGRVDFTADFTGLSLIKLVPGSPIDFISGFHVGCYSLIGSDKIKSVRDLKGKKVWAFGNMGDITQSFFKALVNYVGLDADKDIQYVECSKDEAIELFKRGKIDAFMSFPPGPQQLKAAGIGHVLVDTNIDRPWSQYFCCMILGRKDFIKNNPVATKKVIRSILRANDMVAQDPAMAAQMLVDWKLKKAVDQKFLAQAFREIPYDKWRDYSPEDTIRFWALRLKELGMIKYNPQEIIDRNTDWSHLVSLKNELGMTW
ncbi:MAG: ABC transporter substrate-binding protein [Desulfobacteraceae bacterium]|nr:ABC transporter substrate-binding protein [Desulfobacteraceae bacterium]